MKCEVCGTGDRRDKLVRYSLSIEDRFVVVEHVPGTVCDHCGETTLQPEVVDRLQRTIWQSQTPVKVLQTPVYEFV